MADLLNLVTSQSIPIQRNSDLAVKADLTVMSAGAPTHQTTCLPPPPTFHSTPITSCHASVDSNAALQSLDISQGSLPPADSGSCEIDMFMRCRQGL